MSLWDAEHKGAMASGEKQRSRANSAGKDPVKESLVCAKNYQKTNVAK